MKVPQEWMVYNGKMPLKWMMIEGTPILGNLQMGPLRHENQGISTVILWKIFSLRNQTSGFLVSRNDSWLKVVE